MPKYQIQINGQRDPDEFDDYVKVERAIRLRVKQGTLPDTADIRIVPVLSVVAGPAPTERRLGVPARERVVVVREKYVPAPGHTRVMVTAGLFGSALGATALWVVQQLL